MSKMASANASPPEVEVTTNTISAFITALKGKRGDLDAWLECNSEEEVRAHVLVLVDSMRKRIEKLCEDEHVGKGLEDTDLPREDIIYNSALKHAVARIREADLEVDQLNVGANI